MYSEGTKAKINWSGHLANSRIYEVKRKERRMQKEKNSINYSLSQPLWIKRRCSLFTSVSKQTFERDCFVSVLLQWRLKREKGKWFPRCGRDSFWLFRSLIESWCPSEELPSPVWSIAAIFNRWHMIWARSSRYFFMSRSINRPDVIRIIPLNSHNSPRLLLFLNSCAPSFLVSRTIPYSFSSPMFISSIPWILQPLIITLINLFLLNLNKVVVCNQRSQNSYTRL